MQALSELFRHNASANGKVFDLAASLDPRQRRRGAGTHGTIVSTLAHLPWMHPVPTA